MLTIKKEREERSKMYNNVPFSNSTNIELESKSKPIVHGKEKGLAIDNEETCYFLLWKIQNNELPTDINTRIKFGFNKCTDIKSEWYLFMIYYDYFMNINPHIFFPKKVIYLHDAYIKDKLYEFLILNYEGYNQDSNHFKWFKDNPDIVIQSVYDFPIMDSIRFDKNY